MKDCVGTVTQTNFQCNLCCVDIVYRNVVLCKIFLNLVRQVLSQFFTFPDCVQQERTVFTQTACYVVHVQNNISVYYINATQIAMEIGLGNRTNTILQSAFFRITGVIPVDQAVEQMKKFIVKSYGKKGEDVVNKNYAAVDRGGEYKTLTVDPAWANLPDDAKTENNDPAFINEVVRPINAQDGDLLPVSAFKGIEDGTWHQGTSKYEKRGVAA